MNNVRTLALLSLALVLSGCAGLSIPPPDAAVTPLPEPVIAPSTLTVPVSISLDNVLGDLGLESSRGLIGGSIRRFLNRQVQRNEARLVQGRFVRQQLDQAWSAVQRPLPLRDGLSLFLNPEALSVSLLPDDRDAVTLILGIRARPKLAAGPASTTLAPLPEIAIVPAPPENGFHIVLESELSFGQLGRELTTRLKGTRHAVGNRSVTIEAVRVYGSGQSLVAAVDVRGDVNGAVYLYGTPSYDPATRSLALKDADYSMQTKEVLSRSADWLLHSGLQDRLRERARWYVGDRIDSARENMAEALNRQHGLVQLSGEIADLSLLSVGLNRTGVKVVFEANGKVDVKVR